VSSLDDARFRALLGRPEQESRRIEELRSIRVEPRDEQVEAPKVTEEGS
jgi:hypothetical protein